MRWGRAYDEEDLLGPAHIPYLALPFRPHRSPLCHTTLLLEKSPARVLLFELPHIFRPLREPLAAVAGLVESVALDRRTHRAIDHQDPLIEQIPELPIWLWGVMLAGIGLVRYAYSPLIPSMLDHHWITAAEAGYIGTFNFIGNISRLGHLRLS